jgi:hypothetical protein
MAQGDWVTFEEFSLDLGSGVHDLSSDTLKLALVDDTITPTAADATPTWADYSANEVTGGTSYTAGGEALTGVSYTEADGVSTLDDTGNVTWAQDGSGPTDIYWAILYNDDAAADQAIGFIDMGGPVSLQDGDVTVTWNASGILTVSVTA